MPFDILLNVFRRAQLLVNLGRAGTCTLRVVRQTVDFIDYTRASLVNSARRFFRLQGAEHIRHSPAIILLFSW